MNNNVFSVLLVVAIGGLVLWGQKFFSERIARIDALRFSNTMVWDPILVKNREEKLLYDINWKSIVNLPAPPSNSSKETADDIQTLLSYKKLRTPEKIAQIQKEVDLKGMYLGGKSYADYLDSTQSPKISLLLKDSYHDLVVLVLREKERFDRVRPSFLEPALETVVDIPGHPAYPSGHSSQVHFLAYILGELMPSKKDLFLAEADQIAKNREIGGLHYPSDTNAGKILARQIFNALMKEEKFKALLDEAHNEADST